MADDLENYVTGGPAPQGSAPSTSSPPTDSLDAYVTRADVGGQQDSLDSYVNTPLAPQKSATELFTSGVARNWAQLKATVPSLKAMYLEHQGDLEGAIAAAKDAQSIMAPHGESEWNLQKIKSPGDFGYWFTEKLGEQAVTMLSMMTTGGVGGIAANVAARQLLARGLIGSASARALTLAGAGGATFPMSTAMETAGTSQEQFEVTGSTQPGMSLLAGTAKGALELYAPLSIARALITPGRQLGKSFVGGLGRTAAKEGTTELAQEAIDIYARKVSDPNYSYFKDGFTLAPEGWGEGMWRLAEAGAAGTAVGGAYGAPFVRSEQKAEAAADLGTQKPGDISVVPRESYETQIAHALEPQWILREPETNLSLRLLPSANKVASESAFAKTVQQPGIASNDQKVTTPNLNAPVGSPDYKLAVELQAQEDKEVQELLVQRRTELAKVNRSGFRVIQGGPITQLRNLALRPRDANRDLRQATPQSPQDDALGIASLIAPLQLREAANEAFLDMYDARTPRYVEIGGDQSRVMTDTEIEREVALNRPQAYKPQWQEIRTDLLQPAAITAHMSDLPGVNDPRVFFLPGTPREVAQQTREDYKELHYLASQAKVLGLYSAQGLRLLENMRKTYDVLLTRGLRVIPSRGSGFYYNGLAVREGLPTEVKTTGREDDAYWYNPSTRNFTQYTGEEDAGPQGSVLVSFDKNKIAPNEIVEHGDGSFDISPQAIQRAIVPGLRPGKWQVDQLLLRNPGIGTAELPWEVQPNMEMQVINFSKENVTAREVEKYARAVAPAVQKVMESLGIRTKMPVVIQVNDPHAQNSLANAGLAFMDLGAIRLNPSTLQMRAAQFGIDFEAYTHQVLMHEIGHLVTYHYYVQLPVEIQDNLVYAWNKARMAGRLGEYGKSGFPDYGLKNAPQQDYWITFPEWLAEQFRRWIGSAAEPVGVLEQVYAQGARKQEAYHREWDKKVGKDKALDLQRPDYYFTGFMDWARGFPELKSIIEQTTKRIALKRTRQDLESSPIHTAIANVVARVVKQMEGIVPPEVQLRIVDSLSQGVLSDELLELGGASFTLGSQGNQSFIEIAMAGMDLTTAESMARTYMAHEGWHAVEKLGLVTPEELAILDREIKGNEDRLVTPEMRRAYRQQIDEWAQQNKVDAVTAEAAYQKLLREELRAHYLQQFANTGLAYGEQGKTILARIMQILAEIGRALRQTFGWGTSEDLIRAFFKGEIAAREARALEMSENVDFFATQQLLAIDPELGANWFPDKRWIDGGLHFGVKYKDAENPRNSDAIEYQARDPEGTLVGIVRLENRGPKGFEIVWLESGGLGIAPKMIQQVEKDLGIKMKPSGLMTEEGFKQAKFLMSRFRKEDAGIFDLYQPLKIAGKDHYVSPHFVKRMMSHWIEVWKDPGHYVWQQGAKKQQVFAMINFYRMMSARLPETVWNDPRLDRMFSLRRNLQRDELQGSMQAEGRRADESELMDTIGFPSEGPKVDAYQRNYAEKSRASQEENARRSGLPFELSAPSTMLSFNLRKVWEWQSGYGNDPRVDKYLANNTAHEADRIGAFSKKFLSIQQLADRNEHIVGLKDYKDNLELMSRMGMSWLRRADETAKEWNRQGKAGDREAIADTLFMLAEMKYRSAAEVAAKVVRLPDSQQQYEAFLGGAPPGPELQALFTRAKLKQTKWSMIRRVQNDFLAFLAETERVMDENLQRTFQNNPVGYQAAKAKLTKDMQDLRAKPYFPMVRFGEFTLTVRDGISNKVLWSSAYGTQRERDAAVKEVRRRYPADELTVGRVPLHASEFMSLPGPLLSAIKEQLLEKKPGMSPDQLKLIDDQLIWIEQYEMMNSPDQSFRKRWMPSKGLPGYSPDAFRAYAHYFQQGARYLSRLAYVSPLRGNVNSVINEALSGRFGNSAKRMEIGNFMREHLDYVLEGGRDAGKFRAFVAIWMLGFSPAAAFMNLTQPLTATWPYLGKIFGDGPALLYLSQGLTAIKNAAGYATGNARFQLARAEAIEQGILDVGQAPELAGYAEGYNLLKLKAGTRAQRFWQAVPWAAMWMFSGAEAVNRELTFKAAWDLAIKYPNVKRMQQLDQMNLIQAAELQQKAGLTHQEALAFLLAKETVQRTQFAYDKTSDPKFMRGKAKDLLIFFKYMQSMVVLFGHQWVRMSLIFMFLYGLQGLPGSEDLNELLRLLSRKLFGKDFDLHHEARAFVRGVTRGTAFDETGPDLFLHGISRYGFGLGMLPTGWGAPRFDASANGSMGKVVPGFAEVMHGVNTGRKTPDIVAEAAQRAAGPGYGLFFQVFHYLMDPGSADSKKWQHMMQREFKALAQTYRYLPEGSVPDLNLGLGTLRAQGGETNTKGARLPTARFNATDPDDISTIIAQALGFRPTKVSQTWDMLRATQETLEVYKGRRSALYVQFDRALMDEDPRAIEDVLAGIRKYNDEVSKIDPGQQISAMQLQRSLKERQRQRAFMESTLSKNKGEFPVTQRIQDLYPGLKVERVR